MLLMGIIDNLFIKISIIAIIYKPIANATRYLVSLRAIRPPIS